MKCSTKVFLSIAVIAVTWLRPLHAQDGPDDESKINSNLGMVISTPVSSTSDVVNSGWGLTAGVGYNFNRHNVLLASSCGTGFLPTVSSYNRFLPS